jgi:unsaturated rhamnogalacturonyl hydrolase
MTREAIHALAGQGRGAAQGGRRAGQTPLIGQRRSFLQPRADDFHVTRILDLVKLRQTGHVFSPGGYPVRMRTLVRAAATLALVLIGAVTVTAQTPADPMTRELVPLVKAGPERHVVSAIGLTAAATRIIAVEPAQHPSATQRRLAIVGGLDGSRESAQAVLDHLRWGFSAGSPSSARRRWQIAAVPCVLADACGDPSVAAATTGSPPAISFPPENGFYDAPEFREARYLWRWTTMLGPDLVIEVRSGATLEWRANGLAAHRVRGSLPAAVDSLAGALGAGAPSGLAPVPALQVSGPHEAVVRALQSFIAGLPAGERSPLRTALDARMARTPLDLAMMLAAKYPANPIMSYIPALSWSGAITVSALTKDPQYRDRARAQMTPFLTGERPPIAEPHQLTSLAGHLALADLVTLERDAAAGALATKAADFILGQKPDEIVRFATGWTDDMFMATSVLARAAATTGDARYGAAVSRLLTTYVARLQRKDKLFVHAERGPHAWGRGNGFAAFGLMEALTHLPESWPTRGELLDDFERHMVALLGHQAPDGAWHQVIDEPGSYREFTATAMILTAMARGVRLGWLDRLHFMPAIDQAWRAVRARMSLTGDLVDVCTGTGAGQNATREYYLNRPAIFGADDRGGAMALTAAIEMHALSGAK